jgi:hypothetical protein
MATERRNAMLPSSDHVKTRSPAVKNGNGNGKYHHRHRDRFHNGTKLAAMRALSAARVVINEGMSVAEASLWTGASTAYTTAFVAIFKVEDAALLKAALRGHVPVALAGMRAKRLLNLVKAYTAATAETKKAFRELIGQERLFDDLITSTTETATEVFVEAAE